MLSVFNKVGLITFLLLALTIATWSQSYQEEINSIKDNLKKSNSAEKQIELLNDLTYAFRRISSDSMEVYSDRTFALALTVDYPKGLAIAYKNRGIIKFKRGGYYQSIIEDYEKASEYAKMAKDSYTQAACYNNIGLVYQSVFQMQEALRYFFMAFEMYQNETLPEDRLKGLIIGNIGTAYHRLEDYDKEYEYLKEVIDYAERRNLKSIYAIYCDNFAKALINRGEYKEAILQANKGIEVQKEIGDNQSYIQTLHTLSKAYLNLKEYKKGLTLAKESIELAKQYSYGLTLTEGYTTTIQLYKAQKHYNKAIESGIVGYNKVLETNNFEEGVIITKLLSELYEEIDDLPNAHKYLKEYIRFSEASLNQKSQMLVSQMEAKYQNVLKEKEIYALNSEKENQEKFTFFFFATSILLFGLLLFTFFSYKKQQKTKTEVEEKNAQLGLAEIGLAEKNQELKKYIESNIQLEQFAHVASHDLKSPLRTISNFAGLLKHKVTPKLNSEEKEYFEFIENGTKQMSSLVNDLLDYSRANSQEIVTETIDAKLLIEKVIDNIQVSIKEANAEITLFDMPEQIIADEVKIRRVFQNLISNSIKFVHPDRTPKLIIRGAVQNDGYEFSVSDNGIGIESKYVDKVFLPYNRLNATDKYEGSGMGLAICKKLVEQHGGLISIDSNELGGTTVSFSIKK